MLIAYHDHKARKTRNIFVYAENGKVYDKSLLILGSQAFFFHFFWGVAKEEVVGEGLCFRSIYSVLFCLFVCLFVCCGVGDYELVLCHKNGEN